MVTWQERKPEPTDIPNTELASLLTSNKQAMRVGFEASSYWTDSSGVSAGDMRLSDGSFGPGACRAFFDLESNASSQVSATKPLAGRLYIASDTSRFLAYSSGNSVIVGSNNAIVYLGNSAATIPTNVKNLVQTGTFSTNSVSATTTAFPTAYNGTPTIQLTPWSVGTTALWALNVSASGTTNFTTVVTGVFGSASNVTVLWRSHGTVAL